MAAKILIVEGDDLIRDLIGKVLRQEGYDIVEASDGTHAVNLLHTQWFNLVITDFVTPKDADMKIKDITGWSERWSTPLGTMDAHAPVAG